MSAFEPKHFGWTQAADDVTVPLDFTKVMYTNLGALLGGVEGFEESVSFCFIMSKGMGPFLL